ncbi:hypothetical protein [Geodermatophilus tzadiensis]|uniref:hypothetical protein n=1 Tax=Geodermatophilus tzadiensis TaxID=1137988 RepID=UPI0011B283F8|nr:hypothetical protein [Geodermatophilus tzadiensis]
MSHIVTSSQIKAANRALNALPKPPAVFDVMPSLVPALPKFTVPQVAEMHANLVRNLAPALPKFTVPQVAEMHANLVRNLAPALPKFTVPQVAEMHANLVRNLAPALPKFTVPQVAEMHANLVRNLAPALPKFTVSQVAEMQATFLRNLIPKIEIPRAAFDFVPRLVSDMLPHWTNVHDWLSTSLRIWRDLADVGKASAAWARRALRAARAARDAVLHGRWDLVRAFLREWLDLRHPEDAHLQAAADALLDPGWKPDEVDVWAVPGLLADLRRETVSGARRHRPVYETQINGRAVGLLDRPIARADGTVGTALDQVRDEVPVPEPADYGFHDDRLNRVLALMTPDEGKVCLAHPGPGCTWADAAVIAGFPP